MICSQKGGNATVLNTMPIIDAARDAFDPQTPALNQPKKFALGNES
jgi:hypothetical protein